MCWCVCRRPLDVSLVTYYRVPFFFFFQAEDGIRDYKVTGVQTCALPISDDVALGKGQEHRVNARIALRALDELGLHARRSDVIDDEPAAGHEPRHDLDRKSVV